MNISETRGDRGKVTMGSLQEISYKNNVITKQKTVAVVAD